MGVGAGLYMCDVVVKSSRSLSHLLMSSCYLRQGGLCFRRCLLITLHKNFQTDLPAIFTANEHLND